MRNKFLLLLKIQLYNFAGINSILHSKSAKEKRRSKVIALVALVALVVLVLYSSLVSFGMARMGMADTLPTLSVLIFSLITLVFTYLKSTGVLIGLRDYDMVMSLPVKNHQIVMSRLAMVYLTNLAVGLIVAIPAMIAYGVYLNPSIDGYTIFMLSLLFVPIIPIVITLGVGMLIMVISFRFRHKNIVALVFGVLVVLILVAGGAQLQDADMSKLADIGLAISNATNRVYPPALMISKAVIGCDWWDFLLFAAISVFVATLFIGVVSHFYKRMNTTAFSQHTSLRYIQSDHKQASPVMSMYKREFSRYFSCTIYALNSSIGLVLLLVISVMLLFVSPDIVEKQIGLTGLNQMLQQMLPMLPALFIGISCTTSASLSLEGKNRWIMCSLPVRAIDIFNSKIAVNLTVTFPFTFISSVLLGITMQATLAEWIFLFLIPTVYACFISVTGMFLNVKFPRYDWTSEYYALKGGAISVLATCLIGLMSSMIPLCLCIILPDFRYAIFGCTAIVLIAITLLLYGKLHKQQLFAV